VEKLDHVTQGVDGWDKVLARQESVYSHAKEGSLATVNHLLERRSDDKELAPEFNLAPWDLMKNVEKLDADADGMGATITTLKQTESLKFSGGGAGTDYSISEENYDTVEFGFGTRGHIQGAGKLGLGFNIFVVKARFGLEFDVSYEVHGMQRVNFRKDAKSSIGFHLEDADYGDAWTLDVFIDPYYGTFVFNTVGGYSSCPAEAMTTPREVFDIQIIERPLVATQHDQSAKFVLEVSNMADPTDIVLYTYDWLNPHGLQMMINGDAAFNEIMLEAAPQGKFNVTLTINRGPIEYDYYNLAFFAGSFCERERFMEGHQGRTTWTNLQDSRTQWARAGVDFDVHFQRPCPAVALSGVLAELETFKINSRTIKENHGDEIRVVARNPDIETQGKWQHSKDNYNLQRVEAEYRVAGDNVWRPCMDKNDQILDFIADETDMGMSAAWWNLGPMPDGEYEIRLKTSCLSSTSEPVLGIDYQISKSVTGIMDRVAPIQFGMTDPADGSYFPGDVIGVEFNEDIDCSFPFYFDITLTVHSLWEQDVSVDFHSRDMAVRCERRSLHVGFKASLPYHEVMGKKAELLVRNVMDVHGNPMIADIKHTFSFSHINVNDAAVIVYDMEVNLQWDDQYNDLASPLSTLLHDGLVEEMAVLLDSEGSRIHILKFAEGEMNDVLGFQTVYVTWIMEGIVTEGSFTSTFLINFFQSILQNDNLEHYFIQGNYVSKVRRTYLNTMVIPSAADEAKKEALRSYTDLVDERLCAMVQFDEKSAEEEQFIFNAESAADAPTLRLFYSNPVPGRSWASYDRLEKIVCEYMIDGQSTWETCKGSDGNELQLHDTSLDEYVAHVDWDVSSLPDQHYKVRLHAFCDDASVTIDHVGQVGVDESVSSVINGVIDRQAPEAEMPTNDYSPGEPLVFRFYEDIICGHQAEAILSVIGDGYRDENVLMTCEKNQVIVDFNLLQTVSYADLLGQPATLRLTGIEDSLHNSINAITHGFRFRQLNLNEASASVAGMFFPFEYPTDALSLADTKQMIAMTLADETGMDASRFTVTGMVENMGAGGASSISLGGVNVNVVIEAASDGATSASLVKTLGTTHPEIHALLLPSAADKHHAIHGAVPVSIHRQINTQSVVDAMPEAASSPASMLHLYRYQIRICVSLVFVVSVLYHFGAQLKKMMAKKA
jgi:hypothetical protein